MRLKKRYKSMWERARRAALASRRRLGTEANSNGPGPAAPWRQRRLQALPPRRHSSIGGRQSASEVAYSAGTYCSTFDDVKDYCR